MRRELINLSSSTGGCQDRNLDSPLNFLIQTTEKIRNSYNRDMVFSSFPFLWIFLPIVLIGGFVTQKRGGNIFLLIMSLIFYAWGEPKFIVLLLFSITMNFCTGLLMERMENQTQRKLLLTAAVMINLGLLGYFKYFNFFADTVNHILHADLISLRSIALPIGISFYTFQSISYLADLYRGTISAQHSWVRLALYISFFPQLIAGPIVKYRDIESSLAERMIKTEEVVSGLKRFCFGLAKKVLLANTLGYTVDEILRHPIKDLSSVLCWTAAVFYTLQIFFDFSGYSDMAIGLASVFGFRFRENFADPYCSGCVREFWRRWHISLSAWFRDYLYIPLGGNRKGPVKTYLNLLIVFFATGLWHGAQWNFVVWGLFHGFFLILERLLPKHEDPDNFRGIIGHIYTMLVVCVGWVLFRADDLGLAWDQLQKMFSFSRESYWTFSEIVDPVTICIFIISIFFALGGGKLILNRKMRKNETAAGMFEGTAALICLFLSIVMLANAAHNPFIYFRF